MAGKKREAMGKLATLLRNQDGPINLQIQFLLSSERRTLTALDVLRGAFESFLGSAQKTKRPRIPKLSEYGKKGANVEVGACRTDE